MNVWLYKKIETAGFMDLREQKFFRSVRSVIFFIALFFVSFFVFQPLQSCSDGQSPQQSLIITSDIHMSNTQGRWPENTRHFFGFLKYLSSQRHDIVFINGDMIDNFDGLKEGDEDYWLSEIHIYKNMVKEFPQFQFYQSFGIGHDYGSISRLEMELGSLKQGAFIWADTTFIWININRSSFPNESEKYADSMTDEEYKWLSSEIEKSKKVILLFHVPIRTKEAWEAGELGKFNNLTIDPRDAIYEIIIQNRDKILAIFNGHIHRAIKSDYLGIPTYICPFLDRGSYCVVTSKNGHVTIDQLFYKNR